jgi:hypothetical protein
VSLGRNRFGGNEWGDGDKLGEEGMWKEDRDWGKVVVGERQKRKERADGFVVKLPYDHCGKVVKLPLYHCGNLVKLPLYHFGNLVKLPLYHCGHMVKLPLYHCGNMVKLSHYHSKW